VSYDLHFVRVRAGEDVASTAEAALAAQEDGINPGPVSPDKERRKAATAAALIAADPVLSVFPFDFAAIGHHEGVSESEARIRFRHLELNGAEDGNGIQITLFYDTASLTVPYWHSGHAARSVWKEIWTCVAALEREGFGAYDPQLERAVDSRSDGDAVLSKYAEGVSFTQKAASEASAGHQRRPWWKFWSPGA